MLSLPSKPWKKVKVEQLTEKQYRITFVSPLNSETAFRRTVRDDLELCLNEGDEIRDPDWASRSVVLITEDFETFKRRLIYVCIMIESD